ncbi:MAG TPA: pyruvate kinase [Methanospirillum sp.]|nr:pyruvate kinase [Methanospirillum sp.]
MEIGTSEEEDGPRARLTRIIATIGPRSSDIRTIRSMILAGMDIARLNLSHGAHTDHQNIFEKIRTTAEECNRPVGIMIDIPGPKLRVRSFQGPDICLCPGESITIGGDLSQADLIVVPDAYIPKAMAGDVILIADGSVQLTIIHTDPVITAQVVSGGTIRSGAGVVIPGRRPDVPYAGEELIHNLTFAAALEPDFIALSFVGSADDIHSARSIITNAGYAVPLIAKIETRIAVERFDEILPASDGIMVARGDLGVELPIECVPHVQKSVIRSCNKAGIPVITATEMLESMISHGRPTRAEVTDVANAIADGTDATMLSAETSIGENPAGAIAMMAQIARETEKHLPYKKMLVERAKWHEDSPEGNISHSACFLAHELHSSAIVAFTRTGISAERASRSRPGKPVIAITSDSKIVRRLLLRWGVIPFLHDPIYSADELFSVAVSLATQTQVARSGERLVIIAGNFDGAGGKTNMIKIQEIP